MNPIPTLLTTSSPSANVITAKSANGFHLLWSVVDKTTMVPVSASGVSINFFMLAPNGEEIAFYVNPVSASDHQVPPTACGGGVTIKATASGLSSSNAVSLQLKNLF